MTDKTGTKTKKPVRRRFPIPRIETATSKTGSNSGEELEIIAIRNADQAVQRQARELTEDWIIMISACTSHPISAKLIVDEIFGSAICKA